MTVIFVITTNKYFNVIEETAQTMCMDFINDIVWCIIDCLYQIVPDMFLKSSATVCRPMCFHDNDVNSTLDDT